MQLELQPPNHEYSGPSKSTQRQVRARTSLTIVQEVQKVRVRIVGLFHSLRLLIDRVKIRQAKVRELVEIEELSIGEQSKFRIKVIRGLLLLLLQSLVVRRGDRVQIIDVLGKVRRATAVVVGHVESVEIELGN